MQFSCVPNAAYSKFQERHDCQSLRNGQSLKRKDQPSIFDQRTCRNDQSDKTEIDAHRADKDYVLKIRHRDLMRPITIVFFYSP